MSGSTDTVQQYLKDIGRFPLLNKAEEVELGKQMEAGRAAEQRLASGETITAAEKRRLRKAVATGRQARDTFIQCNLRLVVSEAKAAVNKRPGMTLPDLIQEGSIGLMRAVDKYDWQTGFKFSTYAVGWIRQAIGRGSANQSRAIRLPVHAAEDYHLVVRIRRQLMAKPGTEVTPQRIAQEAGISVERVERVLAFPEEPQSLNAPYSMDSEMEVGDTVADLTPAPDTTVADQLQAAELRRMMAEVLVEREFSILAMRTGITDGEMHTLDDVGKAHGLTRERTRQIEARALTKLRHPDVRAALSA